jgi:hypothetical protein
MSGTLGSNGDSLDGFLDVAHTVDHMQYAASVLPWPTPETIVLLQR